MKKLVPLEKDIEKEMLDFLATLPLARFWKNQSQGTYNQTKGKYQQRKKDRHSQYGSPDILGVMNGRFFGIEVKRPSNKTRPEHQKQFIQEINECGGVAFFCDNIQDLMLKMKPYIQEAHDAKNRKMSN